MLKIGSSTTNKKEFDKLSKRLEETAGLWADLPYYTVGLK